MNDYKRARTVEGLITLVAIVGMLTYGLWVLRDLREIGPIVPDSQAKPTISTIAPLAYYVVIDPLDWAIGYLAGKAANWLIGHTVSGSGVRVGVRAELVRRGL